MVWLYNDEIVKEIPEDYIGFVYLIENKVTGMKYIGKKLFHFRKTKQVNKKKKKFLAESDWMDYYGSNEVLKAEVKEVGPDKFIRKILRLCKSKAELSYFELKEQMIRGVLERDDYYNAWISARIRKSHLKIFRQ